MSNWIKLKDKQPNIIDNNEKVLLYRIMNDSQSSQCISIHETSMVRFCNPDETWWQMLPNKPIDDEYCLCENPTLGTSISRCGTCQKWFKRIC